MDSAAAGDKDRALRRYTTNNNQLVHPAARAGRKLRGMRNPSPRCYEPGDMFFRRIPSFLGPYQPSPQRKARMIELELPSRRIADDAIGWRLGLDGLYCGAVGVMAIGGKSVTVAWPCPPAGRTWANRSKY
ncbi:hypothetical protein OsI_20782 [Oryza sativa Indica Group]|uniref:Uncharacterized protein n=1 Tax=Oryza sativa subsp. indica TaxID=39946 RepID=A2Y6X7_ORYSI|nr:hypothetical protein OsI_20782 [Oryza sativa Indica Group]